MFAAVLDGFTRYHSSVCVVPLVAELEGTRASPAAPYATVTLPPAPAVDRPTTRSRFPFTPGLNAVICSVAGLLLLTGVADSCTVTTVTSDLRNLPTSKDGTPR